MPEVPPDWGFELSAQPHDAFFKAVFSDPANAAELLRGHLPAGLVARIDWESLELVPASFVKSSLRQAHADLLFRARLGGREALLYLLCEHQTTVDPAMPLRLLAYVVELLLEQEREHGLPLPPVLAFVLHQGPERWTVSTAFEDLFGLAGGESAELARFLPKFRHALLDLTQADPASEEDDARLRVALQLMKLARARQLGEEFFDWLAGQIRTHVTALPESELKRALLYAFHADANVDVEAVVSKLHEESASREVAMSIAEYLIEKGKAAGRQEGLWIGKILALQELMGIEPAAPEALTTLDTGELKSRYEGLRREYDARAQK